MRWNFNEYISAQTVAPCVSFMVSLEYHLENYTDSPTVRVVIYLS